MNYLINLLTILAGTARLLATHDAKLYGLLLLAGLLLGAGLWFLCGLCGRLFYKPYRLTVGQHGLCVLLSLLMMLCVPLYAASAYLQPGVEAVIANWREQLSQDNAWQSAQFKRQYREIKKQGLEDFSKAQPPEQGGHTIPLNHPETIITTSKMTAGAALENFRLQLPLLATLIDTTADLPADMVSQDVQAFFKTNPSTSYPHARGIQLAATQIYAQLSPQIPRLILLARIGITGFILLCYGICLLWISMTALRQIKIHSAHAV